MRHSFLLLLSFTLSLNLMAQETLTGHNYEVHTVNFSKDGNWLASGSGDRTAIIWDTQSKQQVFQITEHRRAIYDVAFSKLQNNLLATSSSDGHLILWDVKEQKLIKTLVEGDTNSNGIMSMDFSPTQNLLAVAYMGGELALWDTINFKLVNATHAHPFGFAMSVRFSPDGTKIVTTGGVDNTVKLFNSKDLSLRQTFNGTKNSDFNSFKSFASTLKNGLEVEEDAYNGTIWDTAFSPNGSEIASVDSAGMLSVWREESSTPVLEVRVNDYLALSIEYSKDGKNIFVGVDAFNSTVGNYVKTIDAKSGNIIKEVDAHQDRIRGLALSPDGKTLATASWDATVKLLTLPLE